MAGREVTSIVDLIVDALPRKATAKEVTAARKAVEKAEDINGKRHKH